MGRRRRLHRRGSSVVSPPLVDRASLLKVPGLGASYTFFHSLRANLSLTEDDAGMSSVNSSPALAPAADEDSGAIASVDLNKSDVQVPDVSSPLDGIPALATYRATDRDDMVDALKLVADSIAQQRQTASRTIVYHPITLSAYALVVAIVAHFIYKERADLPIFGTTAIGIFMAFLVAVKGYTGPYIEQAEKLGWGWLENEQGNEDSIIVTKFGEEVIGSVVVRLVGSPVGGRGRKGSKKDAKPAKGLIRGWAVRLRYRGKGVGGDLLDEAVKFVKDKLGANAGVEFADDHANSYRFMPELFNYHLNKDEERGRAALDKAVARYSLKK